MKTAAFRAFAIRSLILIVVALMEWWSVATVVAQSDSDLTVDQSVGDSPYTVSTAAVYNNIYVGETGTGVINQGGYALYAQTQLVLGDQSGSNGTYNLTGSAALFTVSLVVAHAGDGTFNQETGTTVNATNVSFETGALGASGVYNLDGGTLTTRQIGASGFFALGEFDFNGGTLQAQVNNTTFVQNLNAAYVRNGGALIDTSGLSVTISQALLHSNKSGDNATDGGLTMLNTGTLTLTGSNTYTGPTNLKAGTLVAGSATALGTGGTISFGGGILQYTAASSTTDFSSRFNSTGNQAVSLDTNGQSVTIGFGFGGTGTSLTKLGAGTLTINGGNTYTGVTNLTAGTVIVDNPAALGSGGTISFSGGTLQYGDQSHHDSEYNSADYSARFSTAANQSYSIDTGTHNITYASALTSSGGSLTKAGAGTLTLTALNTYTGSTTVNGGTLLINGTNSGHAAVTVQNSGSTLGGTGTLSAAVSVTTGTLNPGGNAGANGSAANVGRLTVGALTLASMATSIFDLSSGTAYDQVAANGNIVLGGTLTLNVPTTNQTFTAGQVLDLFHVNSGNTLSGTFNDFANGSSYTYGGETFQANYSATDFTLTALTSVPEPATWAGGALLLLVGVALTLRRRLHPGLI